MLVAIMIIRATRSTFYCRSDIPNGRSEQLDVCGLLRMREVGCSLIIPQVLDVCGLREVLLRGEACATGLMLRSERLDGHQLPLQMVIVSSRILFRCASIS